MRAGADVPPADADPHALGQRKWLYELSNTQPGLDPPRGRASASASRPATWCASRTRIGYFVNKAWVTEGIRPGVVACSHHLGRWRLFEDVGTDRWASAQVTHEELAPGKLPLPPRRATSGPFASDRPRQPARVVDRRRRAPEPDVPGAARTRSRACTAGTRRCVSSGRTTGDRYGDVEVDTGKSMEVYREWLKMTRPAGPHSPGGLRRPLWLARAVRPTDDAFRFTS